MAPLDPLEDGRQEGDLQDLLDPQVGSWSGGGAGSLLQAGSCSGPEVRCTRTRVRPGGRNLAAGDRSRGRSRGRGRVD